MISTAKLTNRGSRAKEFSIWIIIGSKLELQGYLKHNSSQDLQYFRSFLEMLYLIESKLDASSISLPAKEFRGFSNQNISCEGKSGNERRGGSVKTETKTDKTMKPSGKPEFLVRVLMRQNASWQGELHWISTGQTIYFRSLLELVNLMHEAMEMTGEPEAEYSFRSWKEATESTLCI